MFTKKLLGTLNILCLYHLKEFLMMHRRQTHSSWRKEFYTGSQIDMFMNSL